LDVQTHLFLYTAKLFVILQALFSVRRSLFIVTIFLTACATYVEKEVRVRSASEAGDYETVARVSGASADEYPRDALLWKLEQGLALRSEGKIAESSKVFEEVENRFREEEDKPGFSATQSAASLLLNDYSTDYPPKPYDRIYASTYQALNWLELGNVAAARVSVNRLRFVEESFGSSQVYLPPKKDDKYDVEKASSNQRTKDGLSHISGDLTPLSQEGTYDDALSHWLQGMFYLRLGADGSDLEKARKEFTAAKALSPKCEAFVQELKETEACLTGKPKASRIVYVLEETGMSPVWREQRIDIPLFVVGGHVPFVSVALPAIKANSGSYNLGVKLEGKPVELDLASRPESLIAKHFEAALPGIKAKAFTSAAVKATASYMINKASQDNANRQNSGSGAALLSVLTQVGTSVYTVASTHADLRNWTGLPARFWLARVEAPVGKTLTIAGHPDSKLTLPDAQVLLVSVKSAGENKPPKVRTTILVP
jgi:hypothetical protein